MSSRFACLRGLTQRFGRVEILHSLDIDFPRGVSGIIGSNGAGKTTLLRTLATIAKPTDGKIELLGMNPQNPEERREIRRRLGYLPQRFGYYPNFTVSEFVEYFALLKEVPYGEVKPAVEKAIHRVDLTESANSKLKTLSGGMLRRVGIAQAIVNSPELLLLDEPTAGLDPEQRVMFRELVRDIGQISAVILSTHLIEDVAAACSDLAVLYDGRVIFRDTPDSLSQLGQKSTALGDTTLERGYGEAVTVAKRR